MNSQFNWETKIIKIEEDSFENLLKNDGIELGAEWIKKGELVAFPTETVYGLGADGLNANACAKIFEAKGRPQDNPLILHIEDIQRMYSLIDGDISEYRKLIDELWPGPLTLIFKRSNIVPDTVTAGGETVAIRMPINDIARALIAAADAPIAAPSANRSGKPSPTIAEDVYEDMNTRLPLIIDGGATEIGIESTVVDLTTKSAAILRPGYYTKEILEEYLPGIEYDSSILKDGIIPKSPGQKYRHYAPKAGMTVYVGDAESVQTKLSETVRDEKLKGKRVGVLIFDEDPVPEEADLVIKQGSRNNLRAMAHNLFTNLREFDRENIDEIIAAGADVSTGYGISIMNRMKKSASGRVFLLEKNREE